LSAVLEECKSSKFSDDFVRVPEYIEFERKSTKGLNCVPSSQLLKNIT
jgi:hypothetical protein